MHIITKKSQDLWKAALGHLHLHPVAQIPSGALVHPLPLEKWKWKSLCHGQLFATPWTVHGILQARTLEWVAISFSNAWKWKVKWSRLVVPDSSRPHGLQPTRLLCPWDFPGKSPGVGCHCLLHRGLPSIHQIKHNSCCSESSQLYFSNHFHWTWRKTLCFYHIHSRYLLDPSVVSDSLRPHGPWNSPG